MTNAANITHWGQGWWAQQQATKKAEEKEPVPDKCVFCTAKIEEDDYYYLGYDRHMIYAETCDSRSCVQWLKWKVKRRKR